MTVSRYERTHLGDIRLIVRKLIAIISVLVVGIVGIIGLAEVLSPEATTPRGRPLQPAQCLNDIPPDYRPPTYVPSAFMTISDSATAISRRNSLVSHIWKGAGIPTGMPTTVETNVDQSTWPAVAGLTTPIARVDRYTSVYTNSAGQFTRVGFHYFPARGATGRVVFLHHGHETSFYINGAPDSVLSMLDALLAAGHTVVVNRMPLLGDDAGPPSWNQCPASPPPPGKRPCLKSTQNHNQFIALESPTYSPLVIFVDAEIRELNYVISQYAPSDIAAVGLSGGGWTITLWAALDTRIISSYPVAGTHPMMLRRGSCPRLAVDVGDYEQWILDPLNSICSGPSAPFTTCCTGPGTGTCTSVISYEDLYLLGSAPWPRRQLQLLSQYDSCCFSGVVYQTYELPVAIQAQQLGGSFQVLLDTTDSGGGRFVHQISPLHRNAILNDLAGIHFQDSNSGLGSYTRPAPRPENPGGK